MNNHFRARRAVVAQPFRMLYLQADAAMRRHLAKLIDGRLHNIVIVLAIVQRGMEIQSGCIPHAILHIALAEGKPLLPLLTFGGRQVVYAHRRGVALHSGRAYPAMHHAVIGGAVYGRALIGDINTDPILQFRSCLRRFRQNHHADHQHDGQQAQYKPLRHGNSSLFPCRIVVSFLLYRIKSKNAILFRHKNNAGTFTYQRY